MREEQKHLKWPGRDKLRSQEHIQLSEGRCGKGVRGMGHCLKMQMKGIMPMIKWKDPDELSEVHQSSKRQRELFT